MTVAMLLHNTVLSAERSVSQTRDVKLTAG